MFKKRKIKSKTGMEYAARVLARKDYSEKELKRKVEEHFGSGEAESTVEKLKEYGYVDDGRFREMFIASRIRSGYGRYRIENELREKGLPEGLEDLDEICQKSHIDQHAILKDNIQKFIERKDRGDIYKLKQNCLAHFYRKGHSIDDIKQILEEELQ